jgi:TatD DNase family protein
MSTLQRVITAGHYLSINTSMLVSKTGRSVLERVPHDRILTETDGPYVKVGGTAARPLDVKQVLAGIADAWGVSADDVEAQVTDNYRELCASLGVPNEGAQS